MSNLALFIAGLTDSYNPCSIGVLLISISLLLTLGRKKLIAIFGIGYLATIFLTYFLIGLGLLRAFHLFGVHGFFGYTAGAILITAGLIHLLPRSFKNLPGVRWFQKCHIPANLNDHIDKGVFISGVILGFLIGICTVPCAGGIYLGAIALVANSMTFQQGIEGIFIFNLGFILPLLIIFIVASREKVLSKIRKINNWLAGKSQLYISLIMIGLGIGLLILAKYR